MDEDPNAFPIPGVHPAVFFIGLGLVILGAGWVALTVLAWIF